MQIYYNGTEWALSNREQTIMHASQDQPMLYVGVGRETVEMYRGNFNIEDYVEERTPLHITEAVQTQSGWALDFGGRIRANVTTDGGDLAEISFEQLDSSINRFWIRIAADSQEKCYGCGEQMSYFNLRGRHFPLWSSEPGVGRDKTTYITWKADVDSKSGGDYYNTNYPQPTYVSTRRYYLHADCSAYADFDFRNEAFHELQFWAVPASIRIESAGDWPELMHKLTGFFGRQPMLPEWLLDGVIIGVQGGSEHAFRLVDRSLRNGIKVAGVWCQDWCGRRDTSFGQRLQWNWQVNEQLYPGLQEKISQYKQKGVRFLAYNNCYLVNDGPLYQEAKAKGYFATTHDGGEYLVDFGEFFCGVIDLTNPEAVNWYKNCIRTYMLDLGIDGWMADFGEYLPTDIKLHNGVSAMTEHNRWPALWAKCNYEALEESGKSGEAFFFMRAGATGSQKYCPLIWAGDQSVDFTRHDGLPTTIVAALSVGMCGCGYFHSDIGGYTSLFGNVRTKEVFLRWAEMAVFTSIMRTHEGNRPKDNFQFYNDADTLERFAKLVDTRVALKPYIKTVFAENSRDGLPVQRPLFLHYSEDSSVYDIQDEYLFGRDMLVAPVCAEGATSREIYLPEDRWVHLWSGEEFSGGVQTVEAPLGRPPVFYRRDSAFSELFATLKA